MDLNIHVAKNSNVAILGVQQEPNKESDFLSDMLAELGPLPNGSNSNVDNKDNEIQFGFQGDYATHPDPLIRGMFIHALIENATRPKCDYSKEPAKRAKRKRRPRKLNKPAKRPRDMETTESEANKKLKTSHEQSITSQPRSEVHPLSGLNQLVDNVVNWQTPQQFASHGPAQAKSPNNLDNLHQRSSPQHHEVQRQHQHQGLQPQQPPQQNHHQPPVHRHMHPPQQQDLQPQNHQPRFASANDLHHSPAMNKPTTPQPPIINTTPKFANHGPGQRKSPNNIHNVHQPSSTHRREMPREHQHHQRSEHRPTAQPPPQQKHSHQPSLHCHKQPVQQQESQPQNQSHQRRFLSANDLHQSQAMHQTTAQHVVINTTPHIPEYLCPCLPCFTNRMCGNPFRPAMHFCMVSGCTLRFMEPQQLIRHLQHHNTEGRLTCKHNGQCNTCRFTSVEDFLNHNYAHLMLTDKNLHKRSK